MNKQFIVRNFIYSVRFKIAFSLVWLVNHIFYRPMWKVGCGFERINNIEYISRGHLQSLVNQGNDELISDYLTGKNWRRLSDMKNEDGSRLTENQVADRIVKSLVLEETRREQEALNENS